MPNHATLQLTAEKVIDRLIRTQQGDGSNDHLVFTDWEWPQGVALYSLFKFAHITGKDGYLERMRAWYAERISAGLPTRNVNTTAPMLGLSCLLELYPDVAQQALCADWARWIMEDMPRTEEGGLQHITTHDVNPQQLWDDTLFMTVLFLARHGKAVGRQDMVEEAVHQFLLHIKYLYDTKTGLWFHGWTFEGRHHFGGCLWARGNSWFTSASVEFLEMVDLPPATRAFLIETLEAQAHALSELQHESGLWHTLLDEPASYVEASASAGIAYGLLKGVRLGYLPEKYRAVAEKAVQGVLRCVSEEDGTVAQVSYGTAMGHDRDHYRNIRICPTAYGQGLTFLMLTEALQGGAWA